MSDPKTVAELLALPKRGTAIRQVAKRLGHAQLNVSAEAADGTKFLVFVRVLKLLPENFSIGLVLIEGNAVLLRMNGDHGQHGNEDGDTFDGPHIHQPNGEQMALPPVAGSKPRFAVRVPTPPPPSVRVSWGAFKEMVALRVDQKVDHKIDEIYKELAQIDIGLDDDDCDDHDDHREPDAGPAKGP